MRLRITALMIAVCLLLSGCGSWMDGSYSSVKPHTQRPNQIAGDTAAVEDYEQLRQRLSELVDNGGETLVLNVAQMEQDAVRENMDRAIRYMTQVHPVGVYAVDKMEYELGTNAGQPSLAVTVSYNQNRAELRNLNLVDGVDEAKAVVAEALEQCDAKVVLRVNHYRAMDFELYVRDYMEANPHSVMELPQITVSTYPETGVYRIVEIVFNYQTGRDDLKNMQTRVRPLFTSAELYVSGNSSAFDKYAMLYAFLMERHEYQYDTSITPAYSLLIHGVGDSRAFATVYAAMCRRAGLECRIVSGTGNGEPLFWNIIRVDGKYHHLDLLACNRSGIFEIYGDDEMTGYVWDYSGYPECLAYVDSNVVTEYAEDPTEDLDTPDEDPTEDPDVPDEDPTEDPNTPDEEPTEELSDRDPEDDEA